MPEKALLYIRMLSMALLLTGTALIMLLAALLTGFQCRRFYSEVIGSRLGKVALALWGVRTRIHGQLPDGSRQVVYVSNHTSTIDMFVLFAMGLPNTRFFLSGYLRKVLPLGLIGYLIGIFWTVPQDFPEKRRRIFMDAETALRGSGESVYLSPEGARITTGNIGPFNKGAFHLATALKVPIVPMYIRIPKEIDPGRGLAVRAGDVDVFIAEPVETAAWRVEDLVQNKQRMWQFFVDWQNQLRGNGEHHGA